MVTKTRPRRFLKLGGLSLGQSGLGMVSVEAFGRIGAGIAFPIPRGDCDMSATRLTADDGGVLHTWSDIASRTRLVRCWSWMETLGFIFRADVT